MTLWSMSHSNYMVNLQQIFTLLCVITGQQVAQSLDALRYKPDGRGFDSEIF